MKKNIFLIIVLSATSLIMHAQTNYDALTLSQTELNGTARYMGMAGAFGALGGDASALKDNPAGLGVYRKSEITTTFNPSFNINTSDWNGNKITENANSFKFNNFAFIMTIPKGDYNSSGLISSNFSFSYNKSRNFTRKLSLKSQPLTTSLTDFIADFTTDAVKQFGFNEVDLQGTDSYDPYLNNHIPWLSVVGYNGYLIDPPLEGKNNWRANLGPQQNVILDSYMSEKGELNDYTFGW